MLSIIYIFFLNKFNGFFLFFAENEKIHHANKEIKRRCNFTRYKKSKNTKIIYKSTTNKKQSFAF